MDFSTDLKGVAESKGLGNGFYLPFLARLQDKREVCSFLM